jgi:hypothetical protein
MIPFNNEPEFDVIYAGYPRKRENRFDMFFNNLGKRFKKAVTGKKWTTTNTYRIKKDDIPLKKSVTNLGFIPSFSQITWTINKAKIALHLGVGKSRQFDWTTGRAIEAIFSKAIVLYDCQLKAYDELLGSKFAVTDTADAKAKCKWICKMSNEERKALWKEQFDKMKIYTWNNYTEKIENVLEPYIKEHKGK